VVSWENFLLAVIFFTLVPTSLIVRAWRRYRLLHSVAGRELFLPRLALILTSLSLAVLALFSTLANLGQGASKLLPNWGTMTLSIFNLPLVIGSLLISMTMPKTSQEAAQVKGAIIVASIYLGIVWLLLLGH
jgi:hypothetical protein